MYRSRILPTVRAELSFLGECGNLSDEISERLQMDSIPGASENAGRCWSFSTGNVRTDRVAPVLDIISGMFGRYRQPTVCEIKEQYDLETVLDLVIQTEEDWMPDLEIPMECLRFLNDTGTELRVTFCSGKSSGKNSGMKIRYGLWLEGKSFDHGEVSHFLGLDPTFKLKYYERRNYNGPSETDHDVWFYETEPLEYCSYPRDARAFIGKIAGRADQLNYLKKRLCIDSSFYFVMYTGDASFENFTVPRELISYALSTGTSVIFGFESLQNTKIG